MSDNLSPEDRKVLDDFNAQVSKTMKRAAFRSRLGKAVAYFIAYLIVGSVVALIVGGVIWLLRKMFA